MEIKIDFMRDESQTAEQALDELMQGHEGLECEVIDQHGPSGWPVAKVSGPTDEVVAFADEFGYEV